MPSVTYRTPIARISGTFPDPTHAGLSVYDQVHLPPLARRPRAAGGTSTTRQLATRAIFRAASAGWPTLTDAQRAAWRDAALDYTHENRLGTPTRLDGRQLYILINAYRLRCAQSLTATPPAVFDYPTITPANVIFSPDPTTSGAYLFSLKADAAPPSGSFGIILELASLKGSSAHVPQPWEYTLPDPGAAPANVLLLPSTSRVTLAGQTDRWTSPAPAALRARLTGLSPHYAPNPARQDLELAPSYREAAWWPLTSQAPSATVPSAPGQGLDRTLASGTAATHTTAAPASRGFAFSGTGTDTLVLAHGSNNADAAWLTTLTAAGNDFSLAFWMRAHNTSGNIEPIHFSSSPIVRQLYCHTTGPGFSWLTFVAYPNASTALTLFTVTTTALWDNVWIHIALTRSAGHWTCYKNASITNGPTTTAYNAAWFSAADASAIAILAAADTYPNAIARADFADFRAYAQALTSAEVALLYNAGAGRTLPLPPL